MYTWIECSHRTLDWVHLCWSFSCSGLRIEVVSWSLCELTAPPVGVRESVHQTSRETEHRKGEEKKKTDCECGLHQTKSQTSVGHLVLDYLGLICKKKKMRLFSSLTEQPCQYFSSYRGYMETLSVKINKYCNRSNKKFIEVCKWRRWAGWMDGWINTH